tara:strand:+ start:38692 stop:39021 length:330 start_codon:yes stop_codon:yes gene_type:complete
MKIEKVLEKKVNNLYDVEVEELALLIKDKIEKKKTKFQGYDASCVNFNKSDVIEIFEKYATEKQYGSPNTVSLKLFIKAMISHRVEQKGKERIAKSLLSKVESFFKEDE